MGLASIFNLLGITNGIVNATLVDPVISYRVSIQPLSLSTTTAQAATGFATIFTDTSKLLVGYAGIVSNLEANLLASTCNATNGCGVHIHSGRSCNSTVTQGGHYFNNASVLIDPWINERYSSDTTGKANFQSVLSIGSVDVEGRVFVVHSKNGTRIGCGIIEKVPVGEKTLLKSSTTNLTMSGATSQVTVHTVVPDIACYFGMARNLEPNLVSFMNKKQTLMGMNCNFTNGCGVHIHNGTSCFNTTTQGGHFYNRVTYPVDPWLYTMYHATDSMGNAYFTGCAETGESSFINRPFVVHSNNGTRVSCGLLKDFYTEIKPPSIQTVAYRAYIKSLLPSNATSAAGFVTIFTDTTKLMVGYAGIVSNLEPNLLASSCNATNGCGVHIHSGRSCNSTTTQGGHYFNNASVSIDPWIDERYSSNTLGKANFQSVLNIGSVDVEGRVFIVHSKNGTRIGCGIIEKVPVGEKTLLKSSTTNLTMSGVTSQVTVHTVVPDIACYFGMARNLEPNLVSFMNKNQTLMGMNCNFTNGCGVHIHNGTSCFNTTTQGGHFYNRVTYPVDPWLYTMYHATDSVGNAYFTGCAETGESSFINRPFVVHSNNGTRVSCGLLKGDSRDFFVLINPNTDKQIGELESTVKYTTFPTTFTNIEAKFVNTYKSVRVQFDNPVRRYCDREAPFLIFGDNGRRIPLGPHTVKATPFRGVDCTGSAGKSLIQSFNVVGCNMKYIGRTVPNGTSIFTLEKNGTITYIPTAIPYSAINIEAEVSCGFPIQYIRFEFRNALTKRVIRRQNEDRAPYYVFGDRGGSIGPGFTAQPGNYSINIAINGIAHGGTNFTIKS